MFARHWCLRHRHVDACGVEASVEVAGVGLCADDNGGGELESAMERDTVTRV